MYKSLTSLFKEPSVAIVTVLLTEVSNHLFSWYQENFVMSHFLGGRQISVIAFPVSTVSVVGVLARFPVRFGARVRTAKQRLHFVNYTKLHICSILIGAGLL